MTRDDARFRHEDGWIDAQGFVMRYGSSSTGRTLAVTPFVNVVISVAMAQMQMVIASIYHQYNTVISPKTTDASLEVGGDQVTSAGPKVLPHKTL